MVDVDIFEKALKRYLLLSICDTTKETPSAYTSKPIDHFRISELFFSFYRLFYDRVDYYNCEKLYSDGVRKILSLSNNLGTSLIEDIQSADSVLHLTSSDIYNTISRRSVYTLSDFFRVLYAEFFSGCSSYELVVDDENKLFHIFILFDTSDPDLFFPIFSIGTCLDNISYTKTLFSMVKRR